MNIDVVLNNRRQFSQNQSRRTESMQHDRGSSEDTKKAKGIPEGTILSLDDAEIAVYRMQGPDKSLHVVYSLLANGTVRIDVLDLSKHRISELGQLSETELNWLQGQMRWTRALIAGGCRTSEDAERIPDPSSRTVTPLPATRQTASEHRTPPPPTRAMTNGNGGPNSEVVKKDEAGSLRRGQRIGVKIGNRVWEAVYWGADNEGAIVGYRRDGRWELTRIDLSHFRSSLLIKSEPDQALIKEIASVLWAGK